MVCEAGGGSRAPRAGAGPWRTPWLPRGHLRRHPKVLAGREPPGRGEAPFPACEAPGCRGEGDSGGEGGASRGPVPPQVRTCRCARRARRHWLRAPGPRRSACAPETHGGTGARRVHASADGEEVFTLPPRAAWRGAQRGTPRAGHAQGSRARAAGCCRPCAQRRGPLCARAPAPEANEERAPRSPGPQASRLANPQGSGLIPLRPRREGTRPRPQPRGTHDSPPGDLPAPYATRRTPKLGRGAAGAPVPRQSPLLPPARQ